MDSLCDRAAIKNWINTRVGGDDLVVGSVTGFARTAKGQAHEAPLVALLEKPTRVSIDPRRTKRVA